MSEKKPFGVKEIITNKIDTDAFIPGDIYLIKTGYMSEARFAIHEYTTDYQAAFLLPNKQAMESNRYRTIISIDELLDGSVTIEHILSYSEYMKPRKCGYCKNYKKCNYPGCPMTMDTPACSDFEPIR